MRVLTFRLSSTVPRGGGARGADLHERSGPLHARDEQYFTYERCMAGGPAAGGPADGDAVPEGRLCFVLSSTGARRVASVRDVGESAATKRAQGLLPSE